VKKSTKRILNRINLQTSAIEALTETLLSREGSHVVIVMRPQEQVLQVGEVKRPQEQGLHIAEVLGMFTEEQALSYVDWKQDQEKSTDVFLVMPLTDVGQFERLASENRGQVEQPSAES
jgi:hypothetical protein